MTQKHHFPVQPSPQVLAAGRQVTLSTEPGELFGRTGGCLLVPGHSVSSLFLGGVVRGGGGGGGGVWRLKSEGQRAIACFGCGTALSLGAFHLIVHV